LNQEIMMSKVKDEENTDGGTNTTKVRIGPQNVDAGPDPLLFFDANNQDGSSTTTIDFTNFGQSSQLGASWLGRIQLQGDRPNSIVSLVVSLTSQPAASPASEDKLLSMLTLTSDVNGSTVTINQDLILGTKLQFKQSAPKNDVTVTGFSRDPQLGTNDDTLPTQNAVKSYVDNAVTPLDDRVKKLESSKPAGPQWVGDGSNGIRFDDGPVTVARTLTVSQGISPPETSPSAAAGPSAV
jgi:hypothetical protein